MTSKKHYSLKIFLTLHAKPIDNMTQLTLK